MSSSNILHLNHKNIPNRFSSTLKKLGWKLIFSLIFIGLLYYQIQYVFVKDSDQIFSSTEFIFSDFSILLILTTLLLSPLNWCFETFKWTSLMQVRHRFKHYFKAVMAGVTFSMFTPNRIGEFGGRIVLISKKDRVNGLWANLMGSLAQWITLFTFGWFFLIPFLSQKQLLTNHLSIGIPVLGITLSVILLIIFFNFNRSIRLLHKFAWTKKLIGKYHILEERLPTKTLIKGLFYSIIRYSIYSLQYLLLLHACGLPLTNMEMASAIGVIFLIQTGIPIPPSLGLLARGNVAVFILCLQNTARPEGVLLATGLLWLINVVLPALIGAVAILKKD